MSVEYLIACINYEINAQQNRKTIIKNTFVLAFFALLAGVVGFFYNSKTQVYSIIIYLLSTLLIFSCVFITRKLTLKTRIIDSAIKCLLLTIIFILTSFVYFDMSSLSYYCVLAFIPILLAIFSLSKTINSIKKKTYIKNKKKNHSAIVAATIGGSVIGYAFMHSMSDNLDQSILYIIIAICFFILSCVFTKGTVYFLKWHYINTLEAQSVKIDQ